MKNKVSSAVLRNRTVFTALFAALISVSGVVAIPAGPLGVPIVMQNMMVVLSGALLGGAGGAVSVFIFLAAGALGLPVFSGGTGGIAKLLGPTGGFLAGYFFASLVTGLILGMPRIEKPKKAAYIIKLPLGILAGMLVVFFFGVPWLARSIMLSGGKSFTEALAPAIMAGVIPFIPGEIIKLAISIPLALALRPAAARYINPDA
ncbi:MAG: biotin transporter BioY [Spirochaetaceae bacterium]|jgi:biotin transport system substrate-specific component|nr:biotin transporter BioY [Spirochaetaceae bacterium]